MKKSEKLKALHEKWQKECKCELKKTAMRAVFGAGNPGADIVFIGEAPGKKEDETGLPFIGASGKFLDIMLLGIKTNRNDVYITSIVKYRPPNNRDPRPEEKEDCRVWLIEELNFINPKLIVFLGRHSMNVFFPDKKISVAHGKLLKGKIPDIKCTNFFPIYHPAAALYNGSMRGTLIQDFQKIPKVLKTIKNVQINNFCVILTSEDRVGE